MKYILQLTQTICIVLVYMSPTGSVTSIQHFLTHPPNTTAMAGSLVTLPCEVGGRQGQCQWTKDGLGLGVDLELPHYPRFSMSEVSCDLHISPVLPLDEGEYQCQVGATPGVPPITSHVASLQVTAEPGQPHITQTLFGDVMEIEVGEEVFLECQSLGGKPAAEIEWRDEDGNIIEDEVTREVILMSQEQTFRSISILKLTPVSDINVTCSAKSDILIKPKTTLIVIKHLQKPKVYLTMENPRIQAGDSAHITCATQAYPASVIYSWYIDGHQLVKEKSSVLRLKEISKHLDKVEVTCRARNKVGSEEAKIMIYVEHGPTFIKEPEDILAKPGESAIFTCLAEANPDPTYIWITKISREVVGYSTNLKVEASETDEHYVCKVFSRGSNGIESRTATLKVISSPRILSVDNGQIGGELLLHCSVKSVAKKTKISWIADDTPIDMDDRNYEIIYNDDGLFHHSFLVFKTNEMKPNNLGCFASNEVGTDYKVAPYEALDRDHAAILIVVFLLITLLIIILIFLALYFYKRHVWLSVERMEKEKEHQAETQPCIDRSIISKDCGLDLSLTSADYSFDSCDTLSTTLARSLSWDQSRAERRMGV